MGKVMGGKFGRRETRGGRINTCPNPSNKANVRIKATGHRE
jgi:hypothetical protein